MSDEFLTTDCERARAELPGFVYGELAADTRAALERHLEGCVPCRDELATLRDTRRLLDRWETPVVAEDTLELARSIAAEARRSSPPIASRPRRARLVRLSAMLAGAAAALLFTLSVLGASASYSGGRLQLDMALPGARPSAAEPQWSTAELDQRMRAIAAQEVSERSAALHVDQQELLQRCSLMTKEELAQEILRLTQVVDVVLAENQRALDTRLASWKRDADVRDLEQRQAINDLATYIRPVSNPNR